MKLKSKLLGIVFSIFAIGTVIFAIPKNEVKSVDAGTPSSRTMYIRINNDDWKSNNPAFQLHVWGDVTDSFVNLSTYEYSSYTFSITYPVSSDTNFQIVRVDAKTQTERWNYSADGVIGDNNFFIVNNDGWSPSVTSGQCGSITTGEWFVNATTAALGYDGSITCYLYIYNDKLDIKNVYQMTRMGDSCLFYTSISQKFLAEGIVVVSANGIFTKDNWSFVSAQSKDIVLYHGNVGANAITLGAKDDGKYTCSGFEAASDNYLARSYGEYFLSLSICKDGGGITESAATNWSSAKTVYQALQPHLGTSTYIKNIAYNPSSSDLDKKAMVRYDTAIAKNGTGTFENFIGRSLISLGQKAIPQEIQNSSTMIIMVAVSISALLVVFLIIRKRRQISK